MDSKDIAATMILTTAMAVGLVFTNEYNYGPAEAAESIKITVDNDVAAIHGFCHGVGFSAQKAMNEGYLELYKNNPKYNHNVFTDMVVTISDNYPVPLLWNRESMIIWGQNHDSGVERGLQIENGNITASDLTKLADCVEFAITNKIPIH